ncbi:ATP-binding protein [Bradyrhizobium sp. 186]|uniref:ATP-binding protein n=1 Tax=Bradyrhizobium sp. 186 TaxID=2782654 RepID=UPI00200093D2|nr:ATP-binding protein [Bradyrhizobium sp. 186]UPK35482.1 ATP-binding protein [Bradyrhizobium sp. 186]
MNSFQAIRDAKRKQGEGRIRIQIEREASLLPDEVASVRSFTITDNGIGLNDLNIDSFNESYSEHKLSLGGKGLGRFTWLKAFERVEIESTFTEADVKDDHLRRSFVFDENYEPDNASPLPVSRDTATGTTIKLVGFREPYKSACPKTTDQIVQRIVEHFLLIFLEPNCPNVTIEDHGLITSANDVFEKNFRSLATTAPFKIGLSDFTLTGFRLSTPKVSKNKLIYAANQRGVVSDKLEDFIPNLSGRIHQPDGTSFVYLGIVQGSYLTQRVNAARTDFDFASEDAEDEVPLFGSDEIKRADIRNECVRLIQQELAEPMKTINDLKEERVQAYVQSEAPQYKILMKYSGEFIAKIPPEATKPEIEAALHHELYQRETRMRQESGRIIKEAEKVGDYEEYKKRFAEFMEDYNEIGASALAQYVAHRRIILDFLERAIGRAEAADKFPLESVVHQLIYPMKHTSDELPYPEQNLWMIDERLTYHSFISSDPTLSTLDRVEIESLKRPDLFIFDQKMIYGEGERAGTDSPVTSLTLVEFKRPMRNDYTLADNPVNQCFDLVKVIRSGKFKNQRGRPIPAANDKIPAYCYIIADITPSLKDILETNDAYPTPDGQGYYGFQKTFGIYYEVSSYDKLLQDARKRNRIFFEKLNVLAQSSN